MMRHALIAVCMAFVGEAVKFLACSKITKYADNDCDDGFDGVNFNSFTLAGICVFFYLGVCVRVFCFVSCFLF